MILGTPVSWFLVEVFSIVLFLMCVNHAIKQEQPFLKVLELFGFILGAGLFENVGVNIAHTYYYDMRRVMMIGDVPLEILFIEASIWYAAFNLALKLRLPKWAIPFVVGLFGSVQDMTIDPAAVFDCYALPKNVADTVNGIYHGAFGNGILSGQWNWTNPGYDGGFFGIPWYNFSGWMYLMAYFTAIILVFRWVYQKFDKKIFAYSYPFLAGILNVVCLATPLNVFLLFGKFDSTQSTQISELIMLCVNFGFAIILLIAFWKRMKYIDMKKEGLIILGLPALMHLYDIIYAFAKGTTIAYVPVLVVSAIHLSYLYLVFRKNNKMKYELATSK